MKFANSQSTVHRHAIFDHPNTYLHRMRPSYAKSSVALDETVRTTKSLPADSFFVAGIIYREEETFEDMSSTTYRNQERWLGNSSR